MVGTQRIHCLLKRLEDRESGDGDAECRDKEGSLVCHFLGPAHDSESIQETQDGWDRKNPLEPIRMCHLSCRGTDEVGMGKTPKVKTKMKDQPVQKLVREMLQDRLREVAQV